jgi:hypothetical protein
VRVRDERAVIGRAGDPGEAEAARRPEREQRLPCQRLAKLERDRYGLIADRLAEREVVVREADGRTPESPSMSRASRARLSA